MFVYILFFWKEPDWNGEIGQLEDGVARTKRVDLEHVGERARAAVVGATAVGGLFFQLAVNDGNAQSKTSCERGRALRLTRMSSDDDRVPPVRNLCHTNIEIFAHQRYLSRTFFAHFVLNVVDEEGRGTQVVDWHVEKALNLLLMQVHRD